MIELACITDAKFARHTGAMLHSALARSAPARFRIHVLHDAPLPPEEIRRLKAVAAQFGADLDPLPVPAARTALFPAGYFPRSVWFRVLLPELLPEAARVLYLDSDLIVTSNLAPLWDTDLGDAWLGAVTNPFYPFMRDHPREVLGVEPADYLNSGVLLMNLAQMRARQCVERFVDFAREHPRAAYPDQDALNAVCRGHWRHLHPRWNVQSTLFELDPARLPIPEAQVREARADPAVVHYIGPFKPWQYLCRHPKQALYFEHARATPWGAPELEGRSLRNAVLRKLPLAWIDRWFRAERATERLWRRAAARLAPASAR